MTAPLPLDPQAVAETLKPVERASFLPPQAFVDEGVFEWELENLFRGWVCAAHSSAVNEPGKFVMREIGDDSVVVIGGEDGRPHAFLNVCRHRGARIVNESEGSIRRRIQCPYHGWSYGFDGELKASPHMDGSDDFDGSCYGLIPVRVAVVGGLVLVDLDGEAPTADEQVGVLAEHLDRYRTDALARGGERFYGVDAN
jgi:glycine betaine catabolism A